MSLSVSRPPSQQIMKNWTAIPKKEWKEMRSSSSVLESPPSPTFARKGRKLLALSSNHRQTLVSAQTFEFQVTRRGNETSFPDAACCKAITG